MNESPNQHTKLPIVAQLGVLLLILTGLFSALLFIKNANVTPKNAHLASPVSIEELPPVDASNDALVSATILAESAFVWDVRAEKALYKKNPDEVLPLASITKLMTTLLTYELFDPQKHASLSLSAIMQSGDAGLMAGEEFSIKDLERLALISSSNDAAFALGATVGSALGDRDPMAQFITGMNIKAEELGLTSLEFKSTTGLDLSATEPGAVGSARDVTFLMEYILENYPELIDSTTESSARVYNTDGQYHEAYNTNELVGNIPNLIGSKTGYTDLAGGNLTIAFDAGVNRPIIITVLGSTRDGRFSDVSKLVKAVQASFNTQPE